MKVFLLKDIEKVGMAGQVITTTHGYASNFLIPKKLAIEVTPANEASILSKVKVVEHKKEVVASKTSMMAQRIKSTEVVISRKLHDVGKLYGSITPNEIVDALAKKGIVIGKSQVEMDKSIKSKGTYSVNIKLTSKLSSALTVKVVEERQA